MLTIDRLAKIDNIATCIITALHRGIEWVGAQYEARLVDAAYRVAEAKAIVIDKTEDKISDLEDEQAEALASYVEASYKLHAEFRRLVDSLDKAHAKAEADMNDKLASAALVLVEAEKDYDATVRAAKDKLGVRIYG